MPQTTASVNDLDKIAGLVNTASEIDKASNADFDKPMKIVTKTTDTKTALDIEYYSQQGGASLAGMVIHNYTDGRPMQIDNVGDNVGLVIKNAHNHTHRPDKPIDYVPSSNFLLCQSDIVDASGNITGSRLPFIFLDKGEVQMETDNHPMLFKYISNNTEPFMIQFESIHTEHTNLMNLNNKFTFKYGSSNKFTSSNQLERYISGVQTSLETSTLLYLLKDVRIYGQLEIRDGIKDKNGSTGTAGQVLTANGDGTCQWV